MYGEGWIEVVFGGKVGEGEAGVGVGARACVYHIYECVCAWMMVRCKPRSSPPSFFA